MRQLLIQSLSNALGTKTGLEKTAVTREILKRAIQKAVPYMTRTKSAPPLIKGLGQSHGMSYVSKAKLPPGTPRRMVDMTRQELGMLPALPSASAKLKPASLSRGNLLRQRRADKARVTATRTGAVLDKAYARAADASTRKWGLGAAQYQKARAAKSFPYKRRVITNQRPKPPITKRTPITENKSMRLPGFAKRPPSAKEVQRVNQELGRQTDKILAVPGGAAGTMSRFVKNPGVAPETRRIAQEVKSTLKGKPRAQELFNRSVVRHEMAERAAMRKNVNAPRFFSHHGPKPMLNDMNVAATLKGKGSDAVRQAFRTKRARELEALGNVVYPKAGYKSLDPRRILGRKEYLRQVAAKEKLQALGTQGNRMSRHQIAKLDRLYQDAAKRNTYAFRRASNPLANADKTNAQFLKGDVGARFTQAGNMITEPAKRGAKAVGRGLKAYVRNHSKNPFKTVGTLGTGYGASSLAARRKSV